MPTMPLPTIHVLGVYALPVTEALVRDQSDLLCPTDLSTEQRQQGEQQCRAQLESTVLIEAIVKDRDERFSAGGFVQPKLGIPMENWQVAYDEAYLSVDGESLLCRRGEGPPDVKTFRVAFYIHSWDPNGVLLSSYAELSCPPAQMMAERLHRLVPYELLD